jgi:hypothetical protein
MLHSKKGKGVTTHRTQQTDGAHRTLKLYTTLSDKQQVLYSDRSHLSYKCIYIYIYIYIYICVI